MTDLQHEPRQQTAPTAHRRSAVIWLLAGGLALALLAVIYLGTWIYNDRNRVDAAPGLAPPTVATMLTARVAAVNDGDAASIASFYATDAILEEMDREPYAATAGSQNIAEHLSGYQSLGLRLQQTGTAIALGPFVAEPLLWSGGDGGMVIYELNDAGKIVHQWVTGASIPDISGP